MATEQCKHESATPGKHCPDCGQKVRDRLDELAERVADVLEARAASKSKGSNKSNEKSERTLAEEIGL